MSNLFLWPLKPVHKMVEVEYRLYLRFSPFWQKTILVLIAVVTLEELVSTGLALITYLLETHGTWVWNKNLITTVFGLTSLALEIYCLTYLRKLALARRATLSSMP